MQKGFPSARRSPNSAGLPSDLGLRYWAGRPLEFEQLGPVEPSQAQLEEDLEELNPRFATPGRGVGTAPPARSSDSSARYLKRIVKRIVAFCAPFELGPQYYSDFLMRC